MIHTQKVCPRYSFLLPGFFYDEDLSLVTSQLQNLNNQTNLEFEVIFLDLHYSKRKDKIIELSKKLNYNLFYGPYEPNYNVSKIFDYAILNNLALLSNSPKLVMMQEWRYFHPKFIEILDQYQKEPFIDIDWQIFFNFEHNEKGPKLVELTVDEGMYIYKTGKFPTDKLGPLFSEKDTFSSWGHYVINRDLWFDVGGIDEVATSLKHYADLDLTGRLKHYYKLRNLNTKHPFLSNVCIRLGHHKGPYMGGSFYPLDVEYNHKYKECPNCGDKALPAISDKDFTNIVFNFIKEGKYTRLYTINYFNDYIERNKNNPKLDTEHGIIGFACNSCGLMGETPHWYDKIPNRDKSIIGLSFNNCWLGRNLKKIDEELKTLRSVEDKINLLNNSWYQQKYHR